VPGPRERRSDAETAATSDGVTAREPAAAPATRERRQASRSLWQACEALLSAGGDGRAVHRALDQLLEAFDCEGAALHARGPSGEIESWCARGLWRGAPGDLRDCISVPLLRGSERVGTLDLRARRARRWKPEQLGLVRTAAGALGAALGARLELDQLRRQPGRDPVTGLIDARAFHTRLGEEMGRARRHGLPLAVAEIDLDHFGALNARYGHASADQALAEVALVLKLALRESDVVARLGGDTFVALLPETDLTMARRCAERLCRTLEEHGFARVGRLSASAGVAASPRDGADAAEIMHAADRALSVAKKSGRRRVATSAAASAH
jgi:diguanylate cyclase (GGDEF)-like protein